MKHQNITLSLSKSVIEELHLFVKKRGISRFVEEAVSEKLRQKKTNIEQEYIEAGQDVERNKFFSEWEQMAGDGLNEQNDW
jgi:phage-related protein